MGVHFRENEEKITLGMIIAGVFIIAILATILIVYLVNTNSESQEDLAVQEEVIGEVEPTEDESEAVSIDIGKSVNEAANELSNTTTTTNATNSTNTAKNRNTNNTTSSTKNTTNTTTNSASGSTGETPKEESKEIKFAAPIKGEVLRDFTPDSLVYSETLQEWVTHNGVDIKADKTSVVTAAAEGTVYAIKTDPRYGLTVIVEHDGGYKTVYANLLTAEYVVEGEQIESGQTIGTVGNSATFEIADDYHLHFEMLKDDEYVDPNNYMTF